MRTYLILTEEEAMLLEMYCEAKPFWWRWFFGWRKSKDLGVNGTAYYYKVPKKAFNLCQIYAERLGVETVGEIRNLSKFEKTP